MKKVFIIFILMCLAFPVFALEEPSDNPQMNFETLVENVTRPELESIAVALWVAVETAKIIEVSQKEKRQHITTAFVSGVLSFWGLYTGGVYPVVIGSLFGYISYTNCLEAAK